MDPKPRWVIFQHWIPDQCFQTACLRRFLSNHLSALGIISIRICVNFFHYTLLFAPCMCLTARVWTMDAMSDARMPCHMWTMDATSDAMMP